MPLLHLTHIDRRTEWKAVVSADSFTLGFSEAATVPLPDRTLAAREVLFERKEERYQVRDLAREDRVALNGTTTREAVLSDADEVQIGRILVRFYEDPPLDTGQVVLRKTRPERSSGAFARSPEAPRGMPPSALDGSAGSAGTTDGARGPTPEGRLAFLCLLGAVLLCGVLIGWFGLGRSPASAPAPEAGTERSGDESPPVARSSPASRAPLESSGSGSDASTTESTQDPSAATGSALTHLRRQLDAMAGGSAGGPRAEPSTGASVPGASVVPVSHGDPLGRGGEPEDPWVSRLRAFRLYLDLAERPPTREELGRWIELPPDAQWATALRQAKERPDWIDSVEESFRVLVGRAPYASELAEVTARATPERPPGFWVVFADEYTRWDRRRPRDSARAAASLLVDLTERVPTRTELATVRSSLAIAGARDTVVRVLAHSERSLLSPDYDQQDWWEQELFRFLLRRPTSAERQEIPRWLARCPQEHRLKWFVTSLALYPEYETY